MKKHFYTFLGFLICLFYNSSVKGQDKFVNAMLTGNIPEAITHFESIKDKSNLKSEMHYYATIAYTKNKDIETALNHLEISSKKGLTNIETYNDGSLDILKSLSRFKKIFSHIQKNKVKAMTELLNIQKELIYSFNETAQNDDIILEMSSAKHQGNRNTCSAFAASAIAEYILNENSDFKENYDLSESYNYYISKKKALNNKFLKDAYEPVDGLAGYLALDGYNYGTMKETEWEYETTNWFTTNNKGCKKENSIPSMECFTGMPPEDAQDLDVIFKTVFIPFDKIGHYILSEKKPVLVNIWLYQNGIDMNTGELSIPPKGEELIMGGHVVTLTGYNSRTQVFTFKNSWSDQWGNNGFGTMSKDYLENHFEASKSIPFNLDASKEEKDYIAKVAMGASLILTR